MNGGAAAVSSTTEHVAAGDIDAMTAAQARYHLKRARERIASLVMMLDVVRDETTFWRARAKRAERQLAVVHAASASDARSD